MEDPRIFWDKRYSAPDYTYGVKPNRYFKNLLDALPSGGRLLLLAEGEGRNAVYAAQQGWDVTAVDFSEKAREKALALAVTAGVAFDYQIADIARYDVVRQGPWDVIALVYAHFRPEMRQNIHRKCIEALRPGGKIILEAFNRRQINRLSGGPKDPDMLYSKVLLEEDFDGLDVLEMAESTIYLHEGEGHVGLAEVVRTYMEKQHSIRRIQALEQPREL